MIIITFAVINNLTLRIMMKNLKPLMALLLAACLLPLPYGYYTLVRFVSMAAFVYLAYAYNERKNMPLAFTFGALALLFQPFVKIALGRGLWNIVDIAVALLLLVLWRKESRG